MYTTGVIIARGQNKGLPDKHLRMLMGKPMIAYTILAARAAHLLDELVLTTNDPRIAAVAEEYGVSTIRRPQSLSHDTATVDAPVRHAVETLIDTGSPKPDVVVILYGNIPVRPPGMIDAAISHLAEKGGDSVQSYSPVGKFHPDWMVRMEDDDRVVLNNPKPIYRRQDLTPMYIPNGAVVAVTYESLFCQPEGPEDFHAFLGRDRRGFVPDNAEQIVDVDVLGDMYLAEAILRSINEQASHALGLVEY